MYTSAVGQFDVAAHTYPDTASYGLPPLATVQALKDALAAWQSGSADWIGDWDTAGERCRPYAALLLGSTADKIALLPAASVGVAIAMATLDETDEVLAPDDEFASGLLPAVVAASQCGARIQRTDFDWLGDEVRRPTTSFVVTSHLRSNDGRVQDLAAITSAAQAVGARVLVDATHSAGVLPIAADSLGLDYVVAAAYKHMLCPCGVAFLHVAPQHCSTTPLVAASWRAAADPYSNYVGGDLSVLARTAARSTYRWPGTRGQARNHPWPS